MVYRYKRPFRDGSTHVVLEPLELIARLAALKKVCSVEHTDADPGRITAIDSRSLINFDFSYQSPDDKWTVGLYGRNITDARYINARLNVVDYTLSIWSNDASEFDVRYVNNF